MKDIFLADAHLVAPDDLNYQRLMGFLNSLKGNVRTLFLLGDIFEFWGNFNHPPRAYQPLTARLEELVAHGAQIVWVEGNHDFHLQRYFGRRPGFRILPDGGMVDLGHDSVYIAHGDLVDPDNLNYLRLRRLLRSSFLAFLTGTLPQTLLDRIAARMSRESKKRRRSYDRQKELLPLLEQHAIRHLKSGAAAVVTGHYHMPLFRKIGAGTLIALGDWIDDFSYAEHDNGVFELKRYPS